MQRRLTTAVLAGAMMASMTSQSFAQDTELDQMRAEMAQMRAEMAELRTQQGSNWTDDARRAEIEGLIADVFADAQNRATLLQEGALAGIDEKGKIFLLSADGSFSANFSGQIQARYIWNNMDNGAGRSDSLSGFQIRRTKFGVKGKAGNGWGYALKFSGAKAIGSSGTDSGADTDAGPANGLGAGDVYLEDAYITKKLGDGWSMAVGATKLPFARQELISSSKQVAVDRSLVTEFFTLNRSDQVQFQYENDSYRAAIALSDGGNASFSGAQADASNDFALTARAEKMLIGDDWGVAKSEFGGVEEDALFLGAAVHYESAEGSAAPENGLAWTIDTLYKTGQLGLTAAVFGNHTDNSTASDTEQYGVYAQASYDLAGDWDVFGRWEHIDDDGVDAGGGGDLSALTFGVNNHISKNVKFTADVVWIYDGSDLSSDGNAINGGETSSSLGLSSSGFNANQDHDDQVALRLQLQLLF